MIKKSTLLGLAAMFALGASASVPSVLTVTPTPNTIVTEIRDITITYTGGVYGDDDVFSDADPDVRINNVPVAVTYRTTGESYSTLTYTLGTPITTSGEYSIKIGAGSFTYDEMYEVSNPEMEWTVTVVGDEPDAFQPIENSFVSISPVQGKYSDLQYFTVSFSDNVANNSSIVCKLVKDDDTAEEVATGRTVEGAGLINGCIDLSTCVTEPGTYILVMPEGAFYDIYTDEDFPEARFRFVIEEGAPSAAPVQDNITFTPAADETNLETLEDMYLTFNDYTTAYYKRGAENHFTVTNEAGQEVSVGTVSLGGEGMADNEAHVVFNPAVTDAGTYTVTAPFRMFTLMGAQLYSGTYSGPISVTYTISGGVGVDTIESESNASSVVYRIDGTRVVNTENLPAGIYIIDGKKKVVIK